MSNVFSFYFDGTIVQTVKASISGGVLTIKDALTFPHDELDDFLSTCKEKKIIICCNPSIFQQDIVFLPPAASRQYDRLVRSEVQRIHPELTSFTTLHTTIGQSTVDGKVFNKIAAFSYSDEALTALLTAFNSHGKTVSHIYSAPYTVFQMISTTCMSDESRAQSRIIISALPGEKLLLVGEKGELVFIRKIPSTDAFLLPADTQNINMTLDYCFQTLRVKPTEALMLDQSEVSGNELPLLSVPLKTALSPALAGVPHAVIEEYLAPVAAAHHFFKHLRTGDILPADYVSFSINKKILIAGSILMVVIALALGGYTATQVMVIADVKSAIGTLKSSLINSKEEIATYRKLDDEVKALSKPLEILNKQRTSLHPATALASLTLPGSQEYSIKSISVQEGAGFLTVQIEGIIDSNGFSNIQATFEQVIEQIGKIPGYAVVSSTLDIKQKSFTIQARYTGAAPKGK
jgi:hypothetical protein